MKKSSNILLIIVSLCFIILGTSSVFGAVYYAPTYVNLSENFIFNVTISAPPDNNITQVMIRSSAFSFAQNFSSNSTSLSAGLSYFANAGPTFHWFNLTSVPLVNNGTNQSFYLMMNSTKVGSPSQSVFQICLYNNTNVTRSCENDSFRISTSNALIGVNLVFSGYVKMENGSFQNGSNVTLYEFVEGVGGPPSELYLSSVLTDTAGLFRFSGINGSKSQYKLKMFYNNGTATTKVGSVLPPMPAMMFYQMDMGDKFNDRKFKKPVNLNGTSFYLQPASTLNISATGNVTGAIRLKFGYEIIDQSVGFPVESNMMAGSYTQQVIVPTDRAYTVMVARSPNIFLMNDTCTEAGVMTLDACPAPPTSKTIPQANLSEGSVLDVFMNMSYGSYALSGCINAYGNNTAINITTFALKMMPWPGFIPPMSAEISAFNITNGSGNIAYKDPRCPGSLTFYNMTVMGSDSGIIYMLEFYAKNGSAAEDNPGATAVNLAAFQNVTVYSAAARINLTLRPLFGSYDDTTASGINTTKIKVNIINSTGGPVTTNMHVDVKVKNPALGTVHYIIESLSGGSFFVSVLNNTNWAKVLIYPQEGPPVEKTLNLSSAVTNITVLTGEAGFRKFNKNGSLEQVNVSDSVQGINISFYRNTAGCNLPNPPETCLLTQMDAQDFNPMSLMMAGKVNMEMKYLTTGTTLYFVNFDLFAAKPPTNSVLNGNATSANSNAQTQVWEAGSFVPVVYTTAYVGMPYNTTPTAADYINESYRFNMSLPYLKNEDWTVVWNKSAGDTLSTLPDDYAEYNTNQYSSLLSTAGVNCSTSNASEVCYMNKSENKFWVNVPHFSGGGFGLGGGSDNPPVITPTTTTSSSSSSVPGGSGISSSVTESQIFTFIAADAPITILLSNPDISMNEILFSATEPIENVKVSFTRLASLPETVPEITSSEIYNYLQIEAPKLSGKVRDAKIQFKVKKSWLAENNVLAENVVLQLFTTSWHELPTTKLREDDINVYYASTTPGFSYFAITGIKSVEKITTAEEVQPAEELAEMPEEQIQELPKKSNAWLYVGLVLLALAAIVVVVALTVRKKK